MCRPVSVAFANLSKHAAMLVNTPTDWTLENKIASVNRASAVSSDGIIKIIECHAVEDRDSGASFELNWDVWRN